VYFLTNLHFSIIQIVFKIEFQDKIKKLSIFIASNKTIV